MQLFRAKCGNLNLKEDLCLATLTQSLGVLPEPLGHVHVLRHVGELLAVREQVVGVREELRTVPRRRQQRARLQVAVQGGPTELDSGNLNSLYAVYIYF